MVTTSAKLDIFFSSFFHRLDYTFLSLLEITDSFLHHFELLNFSVKLLIFQIRQTRCAKMAITLANVNGFFSSLFQRLDYIVAFLPQ